MRVDQKRRSRCISPPGQPALQRRDTKTNPDQLQSRVPSLIARSRHENEAILRRLLMKSIRRFVQAALQLSTETNMHEQLDADYKREEALRGSTNPQQQRANQSSSRLHSRTIQSRIHSRFIFVADDCVPSRVW